MIEICALASGSNGNCYYIGNHEEAILVDAGINCKQIFARMAQVGLDPKKLRAIFITHEHGDHVRGVRVLGKKLDIPAYLTKGTLQSLYKTYQPYAARVIAPDQPVQVGNFTVHPVLKKHDATEPTSFRVEYQGINIGVFTDIGAPCDKVIAHLKQCDALFLETNYDEQMLKNGPYPYYLKERISSDVGHLSNHQAYQLLSQHGHDKLQCVFLSHLSAENNTIELAHQTFRQLENRVAIRPTSRSGPGERITIALRP